MHDITQQKANQEKLQTSIQNSMLNDENIKLKKILSQLVPTHQTCGLKRKPNMKE